LPLKALPIDRSLRGYQITLLPDLQASSIRPPKQNPNRPTRLPIPPPITLCKTVVRIQCMHRT